VSFVQAILSRCEALGDRAVLHEVRGRELVATTGTELLANVGRMRGFLRSVGLSPGERVALLGPNSALWVAADLAVIAEGAICVPLYARQDPKQLAAMLRDCSPKLLIAADPELASAIAQAWPEHCRIACYAELLASAAASYAGTVVAGNGSVTIIYTSGTSGEPKGVVLSEGNIDHMLRVTVRELGKMSGGRRSEDRVFHYLPLCFAGSRIMLWSQLHRGNPVMLSTDLNDLQQEMQTAAPHYFLNVPALLERIRNGVTQRLSETGGVAYALYQRGVMAARRGGDGRMGVVDRAALLLAERVLFVRIKRSIGKNLEFLACGSAALSEETQRWFQMIGIPIYQVYGLTETTAIATIDDTSHVIAGRVGRAIEACELKVSEQGELLCRGPNVFAGYWNRPEATAAVLHDGWLRTGDQVEIDDSGSLKVIGRIKEVLVPASGHNVAPAPLEQRLVEASPAIEQAVVFGHGRPYLTALVSGKADLGELERARDTVNAQLPHYMRVRKLQRAPEPFSVENGMLTANQKLKRKAIEERYRDAIEQMYQ
jgi:long-chain acyl-CoA synthetase